MEQTSLEELKRTAASGAYRRIPIWREIFSDIATPVQVLKKLLAVSDHCFLLESAEDNKQWGRYSFLGFDPAMELTCMNHQVTITTDHVEQFETENPAQVIARAVSYTHLKTQDPENVDAQQKQQEKNTYYKEHVNTVNETIARAQERIAKMLQELQTEVE